MSLNGKKQQKLKQKQNIIGAQNLTLTMLGMAGTMTLDITLLQQRNQIHLDYLTHQGMFGSGLQQQII